MAEFDILSLNSDRCKQDETMLLGFADWRKRLRRWYWTSRALRTVKRSGSRIFVNGRSRFSKNTILGNNAHFNGIEMQGAGTVTIGDNFHSGKDCLFITSFHNYDKGCAIPYDGTNIDKDIVIEDNVWLGSRVIVLGGVRIGEGAIVQAGAVVVKDVPKCAVVGGNPAKVFKMRNIEHYERLKRAGKFK